MALFDPGTRVEQEAPPEPPNSAAFEDFAEEVLEPEEPEPEEPEPPDQQARVASDNPQNVEAPDTGTEAQNLRHVEPEDVVEAAPATQGVVAEIPQGTPEAPQETAEVEAEEAEDVIESVEAETAPETTIETLTADTPNITVETAQEQADVEAVEAEEVLTSAVTRSVRPPATRPTEETFGAEDGSEDVTEQPGLETELALTQRSGLDILAEAGSSAIYGRQSQYTVRATGNATDTNYAGKVLMRLNRALRVHKNERGSVDIRFQILPDGSIGWVRIIRSRGTPGIQVAASANVRSAAPFPPPPGGKPVELVFVFQSR